MVVVRLLAARTHVFFLMCHVHSFTSAANLKIARSTPVCDRPVMWYCVSHSHGSDTQDETPDPNVDLNRTRRTMREPAGPPPAYILAKYSFPPWGTRRENA